MKYLPTDVKQPTLIISSITLIGW